MQNGKARARYGSGSIRQRPNGSWEIRYYVKSEAKYYYKTVNGTEAQANRELRRIITSLEEGSHVKPQKTTVAEGLAMYLEHKRNSVRHKTFQEYERKVKNYLIPAFGRIKLNALKPIQIQEWFDRAQVSGKLTKKAGLSAQTLKHIHTLLKAALEYLVDNEVVARNPAKKTRLPDIRELKYDILTPDEIVALLDVVSESKYEMAVWLAAFLGCRRGESLALTWDCIDWENKTITIRQALSETKAFGIESERTKTDGSDRIVAVDDTLLEALKAHKEKQHIQQLFAGDGWQEKNLVCANDDGGFQSPSNFSSMFKDMREKAGIEKHIRLHDLRHTHNSLLIEYIDGKIRMDRMGWSNPDIMNRVYSHTNVENQRKAASIFGEMIREAKQRKEQQS